MKRRFLFLIPLFLLSGCHIPRYAPPITETPPDWKGCYSDYPAPCVENWWEIFQDPCLNDLEAQAYQNNPDLYIAYNRVLEARANAGIKRGDFFPQVTFDPRFNNQGRLFKIFGIQPGVIPGFPSDTFRIHQLDYYFPFDMSYEVDLWGKLKRQYVAACLQAEAEAADYCFTLLGVTTDLASYYFNLRSLDAEIAYYYEEIDLERQSVELTQTRFNDGLISYLDVASAKLELANLEATNLDLIRQRGLFENSIALLIGVPASCFSLPPKPLEVRPPSIPPGLPCSILTKRPDILEAEKLRASAHATVGVAYAALLPSLTITGALGFYSPTIRDFMTWLSRWWEIGGAVSQTVFDGCKKVSNINVAWAQFHEADGSYQETVLTAFREVEDALTNIDLYAKEYEAYLEAVAASNQRSTLSQQRYDEGLVAYLEVLDSKRSEVSAKMNAINSLGASYQSTIQLIKSIGGSWNCE